MTDTTHQREPPVDFDHARVFYLSTSLRRAAMWGIGGSLLSAVVCWLVFSYLKPPPNDPALVSGIFLAVVLWSPQYLLPRVRVDRSGVRRRILWWVDLWPWDAFTNGSVRHGRKRFSYEIPERPWWCYTLALGSLEESDVELIAGWIRRVWNLPAASPVPEVVSCQLKWPDRRKLTMNARQLIVSHRNRQTEYVWSDVLNVEIWRLEPDRRDFDSLRLRLPCQEICLKQRPDDGSRQESVNWKGCSSETVAAFICLHVDHNRLQDFSLHGPAGDLNELNARQELDEKDWKVGNKISVWSLVIIWGFVPWSLVRFPWPGCLGMAGMMGSLACAMQWIRRIQLREIAQKRDGYQAQRVALTSTNDSLRPGQPATDGHPGTSLPALGNLFRDPDTRHRS